MSSVMWRRSERRQREVEGGNFFKSPVTSPVAAPRAKVNVVLTSQAQFQEGKKAWKDPGEKKKKRLKPAAQIKISLG